ncbi:hypothetical protein [Halobaculum sp. D14]|uniref:hypothetical protein n=1 Tax=Halobaculum sp. D14 TaxID=3421642 RepID=UPI003EBD7C3E
MGIDPAEYDDVQDALEAVEERAEGVGATEVLTDEFVDDHTEFSSLEAFVDASPVPSVADLDASPTGALDEFVADHTEFVDYDNMIDTAVSDWVDSEIDLAVGSA